MDHSRIPSDILNDLCSRFILNIPAEYSRDDIRVCFRIEEAHWFYLDFYCADNPELNKCGIKEFFALIFRHCPSLKEKADDVVTILQDWKEYKLSVPTYGAVLLDPQLEQCLLVQGFCSKSTWSFPKGKVNEGEAPDDCAVREVLEETGFDIRSRMDGNAYIEYLLQDQLTRLYIVAGVPLDTVFEPRTRNEIKKVQWFSVDQLPSHKRDTVGKDKGYSANNFFMVMPFVKELKKWISRKRFRTSEDGTPKATKRERSHKELATRDSPASPDVAARSQPAARLQSEAAAATDRQRQKQYFEEQSQVQCQELLTIRDAAGKKQAATTPQARGPSGRKELEHGLRVVREPLPAEKDRSPSVGRKPQAPSHKDAPAAAGKPNKKSLNAELLSATSSYPRTTPLSLQPIVNTSDFFSKAWDNFKLDYNDILQI